MKAVTMGKLEESTERLLDMAVFYFTDSHYYLLMAFTQIKHDSSLENGIIVTICRKRY